MNFSSAITASILFAAAVLVLPLVGSGCGRTACITWSTQEGTCPAQADALQYFTKPECPGKVTAVDSEPWPDADGALCCYAVIERVGSSEDLCTGFGGAAPGSAGFSDSSSFAVSSVGSGFGGQTGQTGDGGDPCLHCTEAFRTPWPAETMLCSDTAPLLDRLMTCACAAASVCAQECDPVCLGDGAQADCQSCLADSASGCSAQAQACLKDF